MCNDALQHTLVHWSFLSRSMNPYLNPNRWANMFHTEKPYVCKNMNFLLYLFILPSLHRFVPNWSCTKYSCIFRREYKLRSTPLAQLNTTDKKILRQSKCAGLPATTNGSNASCSTLLHYISFEIWIVK